MTRFSVHFNVHTLMQIVFLNNFENCRSPFKNEPCKFPRQVKILESCDVQNFGNQVNAVVGAHMKEYRNTCQTTAGQSQLGQAVWQIGNPFFSFHHMNFIKPPGQLQGYCYQCLTLQAPDFSLRSSLTVCTQYITHTSIFDA